MICVDACQSAVVVGIVKVVRGDSFRQHIRLL